MSNQTDQKPPFDDNAEQAVLGVCLLSGDDEGLALAKVRQKLTSQHFYSPAHQKIYDAICELNDNKVAVDITTVAYELERNGVLEDCGNRSYLVKLADGVVTSANVKYYCDIVHEKFQYRQLIEHSADIIKKCYRQDISVEEILELETSYLFQISGETSQEGFTPLSSETPELITKLGGIADGDVTIGVPSGFSGLDSMSGGLGHGNLIILAARPGVGKTAFANCIALNIVERGLCAGYISTETGKEEFLLRTLCTMAKVDSRKLKQGRVVDDEFQLIATAGGELQNYNYNYLGGRGIDINGIIAYSMGRQRDDALDVLFVDYLQDIRHHDKKLPRRMQVSEIAQMLKQLSLELYIPVVLLCQLNREVEQRRDKRPKLSDLKESGDIEQIADTVMGLYVPEMYATKKQKELGEFSGKAELIYLKQRNGPTGTVNLFYQKEYTRFEGLPSDDQIEAPF